MLLSIVRFINMSDVKNIDIRDLNKINVADTCLNIIDREKPKIPKSFFKELLFEPININKVIKKEIAMVEIKALLDKIFNKKIQNNIFYNKWIKDMADICEIFANIIKDNNLNFSLKSSRACKRYHIDNVPIRLLVTYFGKGTEWVPRHACDYAAYYRGENNENIVLNKNEKKFINTWSIALFKGQKFRGGKKGILHRTPNQVLNKPSLLMCLDCP